MKKLFFRYATMGAGKSMNLLSSAYNYTSKGKEVLLLKSSIDTRDEGVIRSRIGLERECITFSKEDNLFNIISCYALNKDIACIFVDEVQFATREHIRQLWEVAITLDISVICYGLRVNYLGRGFDASEELMTLAHEITELKTICSLCDNKATHHLLKLDGHVCLGQGDGIFVGDTEFLEVCGFCWLEHTKNKQ